MQVQMHEMDPRIARVHYHDYLKRVRAHRMARKAALERSVRLTTAQLEREDRELLIAYREMSRENRIVILPEALQKAGLDSKHHLPRLAIARADWEMVHFYVAPSTYDARSRYSQGNWSVFRQDKSWRAFENDPIVVPRSIFPTELTNTEWRATQRRTGFPVWETPVHAIVPKVPPRFAPTKDDLHKFFILFEPQWQQSVVELDPILLSRASDNVFVVVATWDMTPLEASVLGLR